MTANKDSRQKILMIDDDLSVLDLLEAILENEYQIEKWDSVKDGIQSLHSSKPDLIILDINLGEAYGIDTAKMIKLDPENSEIPIIFISGLTSDEDRIAGYEAGAVDFLSKPFVAEEVLHKIRIHINFHAEIDERNQTIDETRQMAFTAMAQSGEIGQVLHFMRDSFTCNTFEKVADRIFEYMESQQLNTAILIKSETPIYFSHEGEIARLDREILERLNMLERIIDFGKRSLYNFENISILIKDMPINDEGFYGRIKDNVCLILEAADAKIVGINNELALQKHNLAITNAIKTSRDTLKEIETSFQSNAKMNAKIMFQLKDQIEDSFIQLGLSDAQEEEISNIVDKADKDSSALYDSGLQIEDRITKLANTFSELSDTKTE